MKIVFLANIKFPSDRAHALQIHQACSAFDETGNDVTLYVSSREQKARLVNVNLLNTTYKVKKIKVPPILFNSKISFMLTNIVFALRSLRIIFRLSDEVIYTRDEYVLYIISFFFKKRRYVYESHEAKYNYAIRRILNRGIPCVCISEGVRSFYISKNIPFEQLIVAHDAISEDFFCVRESKDELRRSYKIDSLQPVVMYVGGLQEWKGVELLMKVGESMPKYKFIFVGGEKEEIVKYKKQYEKVFFYGKVPYSELAKLQLTADLLVIPNTGENKLSSTYTSPMKLFAHGASKVPLLISDVPSLTNVTGKDCVNYYEADSMASMKDVIESVFNNYTSALDKSLQLQKKFMRYTWKNRAINIVNFLKKSDITRNS